MSEISPGLLKTKQHFEILDGLRGVAALAVVTFHFMEVAYSDYSRDFIGHGFLAVDFFFCLSGFVIGYAYDDRIAKMGIWEFFKSRLIRLHPLVIFGSVLGVLGYLFNPFVAQNELRSAGDTAVIFLCSALMIPYPAMTERYFNLFSFNAPAWSLFWEYVANIVYALMLIRIGRGLILLLAIVAAGALCYVAGNAGNLMGGWAGSNFWEGCARISYSFLTGLLIYRYNWIVKNKLGFLGLAVLLSLAFLMPFGKWNRITEPLVVLLYFPLLIALGAGAQLSEEMKRICRFSGNISYPLYMTHYAAIWIFASYYTAYKPGAGTLALVIIAGLIVLTGFAWLVMGVYDLPLRKYLAGKRAERIKQDAG